MHGLFQRPGIERLPWSEDAANPAKNKCKDYPMGYWPGDFAQVHPQEGKHYLFVALDRVGKVAFAELPPRAKRVGAADLLRRGRQALPDQAHTVLPDKGGPFPPPPQQGLPGRHRCDRVCRALGVEHRLTKPAPPCTNGQVERRNRPLQEAPGRRSPYQPTAPLHEPLQAFLVAYQQAKRLKSLRGLTPHEFVGAQHRKTPGIFTPDPTHFTRGLYN